MRGGYNYNPGCCYPRRMVNFCGNDMLFFKQRFSKPSAIPSGDGLGEETRRIAVIEAIALLVVLQQMNQLDLPGFSHLGF